MNSGGIVIPNESRYRFLFWRLSQLLELFKSSVKVISSVTPVQTFNFERSLILGIGTKMKNPYD